MNKTYLPVALVLELMDEILGIKPLVLLSLPGAPAVPPIGDLIVRMRGLLAGPSSAATPAYQLARDDQVVTLPHRLTLFHGTLAEFAWNNIAPLSWFSTNLGPPCGVIGEQSDWRFPRGDPRVYECEVVAPLRLLLRGARRWKTGPGHQGPLERFADEAALLPADIDGVISPHHEEELRLKASPAGQLRLIRTFSFDTRFIAENSDLFRWGSSGQEVDSLDPRPSLSDPAIELAYHTRESHRLFAYSLLRQFHEARSQSGLNATYGLIRMGTTSAWCHNLVAFARPRQSNRVWDTQPGAVAYDDTVRILDTENTESEQQQQQQQDLRSRVLAFGSWNSTRRHDMQRRVMRVYDLTLFGVGRTGDDEQSRRAEHMIWQEFAAFIQQQRRSRDSFVLRLPREHESEFDAVMPPASFANGGPITFQDHRDTTTRYYVLKEWTLPRQTFLAQLIATRDGQGQRIIEAEEEQGLIRLWKETLAHERGPPEDLILRVEQRSLYGFGLLNCCDCAVWLDLPDLLENILSWLPDVGAQLYKLAEFFITGRWKYENPHICPVRILRRFLLDADASRNVSRISRGKYASIVHPNEQRNFSVVLFESIRLAYTTTEERHAAIARAPSIMGLGLGMPPTESAEGGGYPAVVLYALLENDEFDAIASLGLKQPLQFDRESKLAIGGRWDVFMMARSRQIDAVPAVVTEDLLLGGCLSLAVGEDEISLLEFSALCDRLPRAPPLSDIQLALALYAGVSEASSLPKLQMLINRFGHVVPERGYNPPGFRFIDGWCRPSGVYASRFQEKGGTLAGRGIHQTNPFDILFGTLRREQLMATVLPAIVEPLLRLQPSCVDFYRQSFRVRFRYGSEPLEVVQAYQQLFLRLDRERLHQRRGMSIHLEPQQHEGYERRRDAFPTEPLHYANRNDDGELDLALARTVVPPDLVQLLLLLLAEEEEEEEEGTGVNPDDLRLILLMERTPDEASQDIQRAVRQQQQQSSKRKTLSEQSSVLGRGDTGPPPRRGRPRLLAASLVFVPQK